MTKPNPKVLISASSDDLGFVREAIKKSLLQLQCMPKEQTDFGPEYRTAEAFLEATIRDCDAIIHVALVEDARARFLDIEKLASLTLNEPVVPIIEAILGAAKSERDMLAQLDAPNSNQKLGTLWSIPIAEPISPVLEKLETRQP